MAATDLGKVGMVMKGTWSSSATYEILDAVTYNGSLYIAKQAVPANTLPTNTTYWQLAATGDIATKAEIIRATSGSSSTTLTLPIKQTTGGGKIFFIMGMLRTTTLSSSAGFGVFYIYGTPGEVIWIHKENLNGVTSIEFDSADAAGNLSVTLTGYMTVTIIY